MPVLLALDVGTTKLCAIALDWPSRRLLAERSCINDATLGPGEQDAGRITTSALTLLEQVASDPAVRRGDVAGIGVTGQMHGVVLVDEHDAPASPLVTWQDQRGAVATTSGRSWAQTLADRLGPQRLALTGGAPATGYGGVTLLRWAGERRAFHRCRALSIMDYLVLSLCGAATTDPSIAASWGVADASSGRWVEDVQAVLGEAAGALPTIRPAASVAGALRATVATRLGLSPRVPVAVAIGDNQASFIGSVPSIDGTVLFNLGTGGQMSMASSRFARVPGLETRPLVTGHWLLVGASLCGGRGYAILADFFNDVAGSLLNTAVDATKLYEAMNQAALRHLDDTAGLHASTLLSGTRQDPHQRGAVTGLSPTNFTAGHLCAAFVHGIVDELTAFYRLAHDAGVRAQRLVGSGNAIRRNPAMRLAAERQMGLAMTLPDVQEEAAVGAAVTAAVAAGLHRW
jgi:sugar (pentulose or hexulose) kinase